MKTETEIRNELDRLQLLLKTLNETPDRETIILKISVLQFVLNQK